MFATQVPSSPSTPFRQATHYTPVRPSPLGPRSSNIATPPWTMGSPPNEGQAQKPSGSDENAQFSPVYFPAFQIHNAQQENPQQAPQRAQQIQPIFGNASSTSPLTFPKHQSTTLMSPTSPSPSTRSKYADRYTNQIANPLKTSNSLARSKTRKMF